MAEKIGLNDLSREELEELARLAYETCSFEATAQANPMFLTGDK